MYIHQFKKFQEVMRLDIEIANYKPHQAEIFVKSIPRDASVTELMTFFSQIGKVFQIRLMIKEKSVLNRGFAYVEYFNSELAETALNSLNNKEFRPGTYLILERSRDNCRLFIGGIPVEKTKDEIWQELKRKGVCHVMDVIMYRSYTNRLHNRGFVFVEFLTHEIAASFRAKHCNKLKLFNRPVIVDWSLPQSEPGEQVMKKVKILYLRNLEINWGREHLIELVLKYIPFDKLEKVYKFKDYAFVHLSERKYAEFLLTKLQEFFKGSFVEITFAKPASKITKPEYRFQRIFSSKGHREDMSELFEKLAIISYQQKVTSLFS